MYGKKMMELRQNQKADVVLKQELDYCTTGCLLYVCLYSMARSIRCYDRASIAFEKLRAWRAVEQ